MFLLMGFYRRWPALSSLPIGFALLQICLHSFGEVMTGIDALYYIIEGYFPRRYADPSLSFFRSPDSQRGQFADLPGNLSYMGKKQSLLNNSGEETTLQSF